MAINDTNNTIPTEHRLAAGRNFAGRFEELRDFNTAEEAQIQDAAVAGATVPTAVQTALDLKSPLASPTFTGTVTLPALTRTGLELDTSIQSLTTAAGSGIVNVTSSLTKLTSTGADALSLANGTNGQRKEIVMVVDGGDATLTPTTKTGFSTAVFNDLGDTLVLRYYTTLGWMIVSNYGCTIT